MPEEHNKKDGKDKEIVHQDTRIQSWYQSLIQKISDKEKALSDFKEKSKRLEKVRNDHQSKLDKLINNMKDVLKHMKHFMLEYKNNMSKKMDETLKNDQIDIWDQGENMMKLHQEMYKDACKFFSKKEFQKVVSVDKEEPIPDFLTMLTTYWLLPDHKDIEQDPWVKWDETMDSMNDYYSSLQKDRKDLETKLFLIIEKIKEINKHVEIITNELTLLQIEKKEVQQFSRRINACRLKQDSNGKEVEMVA